MPWCFSMTPAIEFFSLYLGLFLEMQIQICSKTYLLDRYSIRADVPPATPNGSNGFAKRDVNLKKKTIRTNDFTVVKLNFFRVFNVIVPLSNKL